MERIRKSVKTGTKKVGVLNRKKSKRFDRTKVWKINGGL